MTEFKIVSDYRMMGDQQQAVEKLAVGVLNGRTHQSLMGVTGSGKTFTMANVIERVQKPIPTAVLERGAAVRARRRRTA